MQFDASTLELESLLKTESMHTNIPKRKTTVACEKYVNPLGALFAHGLPELRYHVPSHVQSTSTTSPRASHSLPKSAVQPLTQIQKPGYMLPPLLNPLGMTVEAFSQFQAPGVCIAITPGLHQAVVQCHSCYKSSCGNQLASSRTLEMCTAKRI